VNPREQNKRFAKSIAMNLYFCKKDFIDYLI